MGTTSQKLTYLNETKQELKQKINNLGGDITDQTAFRQYANQLQNVYDNLPKTEYQEGTEVNLGKTSKGKLDFDDGKVGFGQASQDTTEGTNLIDVKSGTVNSSQFGVTTSLDGDFILVNGSRNDGSTTSARSLISSITNFGNLTSGETYKISIHNVSGTFTGSIGITFRSDSSQLDYIQIYNSTSNTKELTFSTAVTSLTVFFNGAFSANNLRFKLMLQKGTADKSYEQYSGGYSSPSPNWEQEIKYVRGRNIVESKNVKSITTGYSDVLFTQADLKPNTTYTISFEGVAGNKIYANENLFILEYMTIPSGRASLVVTTKATISKNTRTQYQEENGGWLIFKNNGDGNPTANVFDNLQIEEGYEATPYLPYNTIEEVVSGKNLFEPTLTNEGTTITRNNVSSISVNDGEFTFVASGSDMYFGNVIATGGSYANERGIKIYRNGNEKISYKCTNNLFNKNYICAFDSDGISLGYSGTLSYEGTYTFPNNCEYITFRFGKGDAVSGTTYKTKVILAYGDTIPDYEPYKTPKTYQFSLGDHKFYGIGTYRDYILRTTGKNLFDKDNITDNTGYTGNVNDTLSTNTNTATFIAPLITSNNGNIAISSNKTSATYRVRLIDSNNKILSSTAYTTMPQTIDTRNCDKIAIMFDKTTITIADNIQIEEGSTASDYQPYGVGNWYKVGNLLKIDITKDLNWLTSASGKWWYFSNYMAQLPIQSDSEIMSNYFKKGNWNNVTDSNTPYIISLGTASNGIIGITTASFNSLDDLKTFLNNNNVYAIAQLRAPTYTPITGTLAEQLEEWWNGQTLNGTTIITSYGNLPMIIKVRGLKGE